MATNKDLLYKGVKYSVGSFPVMFIAPLLIQSSFKNQSSPFFIPVLIIGVVIAFLSAYLLFKGVKTITDALFNDESKKK